MNFFTQIQSTCRIDSRKFNESIREENVEKTPALNQKKICEGLGFISVMSKIALTAAHDTCNRENVRVRRTAIKAVDEARRPLKEL